MHYYENNILKNMYYCDPFLGTIERFNQILKTRKSYDLAGFLLTIKP